MVLENLTYNANLAESLQDIGERLRIIRLQQELSLDAIALQTKIPAKHLSAIESGDPEGLPELVYIRGFIRRYALAVNQDVANFDLVVQEPKPSFKQRISMPQIRFGVLMQKLQYPLYALMVVGVGSALMYLNNRDFNPTPAQSSVEAPVIGQRSEF